MLRWLSKLARKWITQADRVVCAFKRQAKIIVDLVLELESKIEVVYNPPLKLIDRGVSKSLNSIPTFLYIDEDRYVKASIYCYRP